MANINESSQVRASFEGLVSPKSVAIIGASKDEKKLGFQILKNIQTGGYKGKIYPINLKEKEIAGLKAFAAIDEIGTPVDLAIIVIPAGLVTPEVKKCASVGTKNIIIISAGFNESGVAGKAREEELKKLGDEFGINILGPNCLGEINTAVSLNATFARSKGRSGEVAFISQSGAICSAVLDWAEKREVGFSKFISLGNKAVLDENDFFEYLAADKSTKLVIAYLEDIKSGRKFMAAASRLCKIKPVAILKAGQSKAGAAAAMSHTGSLAGSQEAVLAAMRRSGVIILESLEEMFNLIAFSQRQTELGSKELFVVSNAGGPLVLVADQLSSQGIDLGELSAKTIDKLKKKLPPIINVKNPLDIIGDADAKRFKLALETVLDDDKVQNLLVLLTPQTATEVEKTAEVIGQLGNKHKDKMICTSFIGEGSVEKAKEMLAKENIVNFSFPDAAIKILAKLIKYQAGREFLEPYNYQKTDALPASDYDEQLDFFEAQTLLKSYEIDVVPTRKVENEEALVELEYPAVLKVVGKKLIHKTERRAIALNLRSEKEAALFYAGFLPMLREEGNSCITQPMIEEGIEIIVGFKRDKSFGPLIMVGLGGIYAEIFKDVAIEVDDLDSRRALEMLKGLNAYKILNGARGRTYDVESLVTLLLNLAKLAREHKEIKELDLNPLFVKQKGAVAVDFRIIV